MVYALHAVCRLTSSGLASVDACLVWEPVLIVKTPHDADNTSEVSDEPSNRRPSGLA
jgi:hypothetical protein